METNDYKEGACARKLRHWPARSVGGAWSGALIGGRAEPMGVAASFSPAPTATDWPALGLLSRPAFVASSALPSVS